MKTILLTGATGAVGQAAAKALAEQGNVHIVLAGRDNGRLTKLKNEISRNGVTVEVLEVDLSDINSVKNAVGKFIGSHQNLNAIVNVAAVYKANRATSPQGHEMMLATNHLGPFQLSTRLMPLLKASPGSKVITVAAPSSTKLNFDDLNYEQKYSSLTAFGASKMMNLLFAFRLGEMFKGSSHASIAFHPGLIKSDLLKESAPFVKGLFRLISARPEKPGKAIARLVMEGDPATQNGKFFNSSLKEMKASVYAYGPQVQEKLWKLSETLVNS
jgi:retinol dehydrogenase 12